MTYPQQLEMSCVNVKIPDTHSISIFFPIWLYFIIKTNPTPEDENRYSTSTLSTKRKIEKVQLRYLTLKTVAKGFSGLLPSEESQSDRLETCARRVQGRGEYV